MTYLLFKGVQLFSVAYTVRSSLKALKVITSEQAEDEEVVENAKEALMFWSIQGLLLAFDQYLEFLVRWFPGYYYIKSAFLLLICFPNLRFTQYVNPLMIYRGLFLCFALLSYLILIAALQSLDLLLSHPTIN